MGGSSRFAKKNYGLPSWQNWTTCGPGKIYLNIILCPRPPTLSVVRLGVALKNTLPVPFLRLYDDLPCFVTNKTPCTNDMMTGNVNTCQMIGICGNHYPQQNNAPYPFSAKGFSLYFTWPLPVTLLRVQIINGQFLRAICFEILRSAGRGIRQCA